MTVARRLSPGTTHTVSRRCAGRQFLLKPVPRVNAILGYTLGLGLSRAEGVKLHALCVESSHHHALLTDDPEEARLPELFRTFHSLSARAINCHWGRGESLWCPGSYSNVEIHDDPAGLEDGEPLVWTLEEQLLYVWTQPVRDGLVERPSAWPGLRFLPEDLGTEVTFHKPEGAFFGGCLPPDYEPTDPNARRRHRRALRREREELRRRQRLEDRRKGRSKRHARHRKKQRERKERIAGPKRRVRETLPESVTFRIHPPPGYEDWPIEEVRAHFRRLLDARVEQIHEERRQAGLTEFLGVDAILRQSPFARSGSTRPTFALDPRLACRQKRPRIFLIAGLQQWRHEYWRCYQAWRDGNREVVFPAGTYGMRRFHGAAVAEVQRGPPYPTA